MTFQEAVISVVRDNYFNLKGRAPRSEYWWFFLAYLLGGIVISLTGVGLLQVAYSLALFLPFLGVGFRRMQDTGRPGWYYLIPTVFGLISQLFSPAMNVATDPETGVPLEVPGMGTMAFGAVMGLIGLVMIVLFLWWLTRPSDPEPNAYGPPPVEARRP